ncbi:ecto-NOX disulfide-thiol exchanger 2 isoform X1 [Drosophila subpulchrella]|uniref:ecto-NOX disulfide-thiol exchanger 2 isoform X1 n=2 Tax=Drosophila subpulchrella TaxID=1486046 RepID=UPI0018A18AF1|nr:ecto-NOX disulfide-thiol exchanger 2 isoform X1 [Drosophila subpulchrella]
MLPLFGTMPNGVSLPNHPNFLNQLAAAISTAASTTSVVGNPSSPPKQNQNKMAKPQQQPQGSAPMDLENENEHSTDVSSTTAHKDPKLQATSSSLSLPDSAQLYLNGLMHTPPGYLYFPAAQAGGAPAPGNAPATGGGSTAAASGGSAANAQMLMDPTAMMAAAMQQMQQMHYAAAAAAGMTTETGAGLEAALSADGVSPAGLKEVIKTKNCILFPPNPNAPPPTIRERPPGCRTVFVGGLPENITEEVIREIFESCGEITTLRMSKKNFCHIRYRQEGAIDRAIYLSGYRLRISALNEPPNFGRLHVDYAQARDDQYDYECRQRQHQREQRHRERMSMDRMRSQSPPPIPHYTDHEATAVAEHLRTNETFVKAIQTITAWLERGDCTKRNANVFYSMIQSTHAHVRRLHADKLQLEEDLKKARDSYRNQMGTMSTQFTQIEKVFNAASHKKVWDHFTKAQRKNIDQWKKLATELRTVQIIDDDEMEISDDERDYDRRGPSAKRIRYDSESLKDENDSLRCQLEAIRHEMNLERSDYVQREKQIKVLQETIRNMQTQLLQTKLREQKDTKVIEQLERNLKDAGVKQLLLKTKIKETADKLKDKEANSTGASNASNASNLDYSSGDSCSQEDTEIIPHQKQTEPEIIDIDKVDDDVTIIIEHQSGVVEIHEIEDDEKLEPAIDSAGNKATKSIIESISKSNSEENINKISSEHTPTSAGKEVAFKSLTLTEAKIIALASAYLVLHPHGVDIANIASYLSGMLCNGAAPNNHEDLANILGKYTNLFKSDQAKWRFCGFSEPTESQSESK